MKYVKRIAALGLALVMSLSLISCGKTGSGSQSGEEQITLTIGIPGKVNVLDWEDNAFTKWLEEETGYNLEFHHFAASNGEAVTQLATIMAGGEKMPDLILGVSLMPEERDQFGKEGYFVDLNTYFNDEEFMSNYRWNDDMEKNVSQEIKDRLKLMSYDIEGHMYAFPRVMCAVVDTPGRHAWINQVWLDNLGLEMPTNLDELKEVATAFLTQDPNGNGQADEIPMIFQKSGGGSAVQWIVENYSLGTLHFYGVDSSSGEDKIYLPWLEEEYREGLKKVREFYDAGLIPDVCWTMASVSELASITSPADNVAKVGIIFGTHTNWAKNETPVMDEYVGLFPFEGSNFRVSPVGIYPAQNFITTDCEHPEAAMDLLLTIASPEGVQRQRYGVPGEDWVWATDYDLGIEGQKILNQEAFSGQTKQTWGIETVRLSWWTDPEDVGEKDGTTAYSVSDALPEERTWAERRTSAHRLFGIEYLKRAAEHPSDKNKLEFTPLFTLDETNELIPLENSLYSLYTEMGAKFCVGEEDIYDDAVWAKYLADAEKMGAQRCVEIQQTGYDRSMSLLDK